MSSSYPNLKPMSAGDVLDQAIRIFRQNFIGLVSIVAIINVPILLLQVLLSVGLLGSLNFPLNGGDLEPGSVPDIGPAFFLYYFATLGLSLVTLVLLLFQNGALTFFVSERFLGRPVTVRQAYRKAWSRGMSLFIAAILLVLANAGLLVVFVALFFIPFFGIGLVSAGGGDSSGLAAAAGLLTLCACILILPAILFSIFITTRWIFYSQAIVIENYNSTGGLGRSWRLVKGTFWRIFGFSILLSIIVSLFTAGPIYAVAFGSVFLPFGVSIALNSVLSGLIAIVMTPLQMAALTVLYYDVRIRKEGFDLQYQMQASAPSDSFRSIMEPASNGEPPQPSTTPTPPAAPAPSPASSPDSLPPLYDRTPPAEMPPPNTLTQLSLSDEDKPAEPS